MKEQHPSYPNPTIQEAICEVHFGLAPDAAWKPSYAGDLFKRIEADFPQLEPVAELGFEVQVSKKGALQAFLPPRQRTMYRHASRPLLLQLAEGVLTVNELPPYPGWQQMAQDVLGSWEQVRAVAAPSLVNRVGLRYINHIPRTDSHERPGQWLAASEYIPPSVLSSLPGLLYRSQTWPDPEHRLIVTVTEAGDPSRGVGEAILFDIDCIVEREIDVERQALAEEINDLHDLAWEVFHKSQTGRLSDLLQGGGS